MHKISAALTAAFLFGVPCAAMAQQTSTEFSQPSAPQVLTPPVSPSAITGSGATSSPLTPTPNASPLTPTLPNSAITVRGSSEVPSILSPSLSPSPTETNRVDPSASSRLLVTIDPSRSNVSTISGTLQSTQLPASGVQLNTIIAPASTIVTPQPSPLSPSLYPTRIRDSAATTTFLSGFRGVSSPLTGRSLFPNRGLGATGLARITSRGIGR